MDNLKELKRMFAVGNILVRTNHRFPTKLMNAAAGEPMKVRVMEKRKDGAEVSLPNNCISFFAWPHPDYQEIRNVENGFEIHDRAGLLITYIFDEKA